uniref:Free fatty acid receptor 1 n=1 Tax=Podarcis muralis TaxID=64176 RepID=A0A670IHL7_PODMU|nr:free fatty acid receptor 2-like [Podarcis muralis]
MSLYNAMVLAVYIFAFLAGLPANLLAFYTFQAKVRQKATPIEILLFNLTVSDVILLLFLPFKMVEAASDMTWPLPMFLCPLTNFCYYSSIYISTLFLMAISVERYLGVAYPIRYKLNRRPMYAVFASILFWFLACSHCSIVYIVELAVPDHHNETISNSANASKCYESFSPNQLDILLPVRLELCITLFFLPFLITLFCYVNLVRILTSLPNIHARRKQRAVGLAVATLLNFAVCFAPYNISHIVGFIQNESPSWRVYALLLSTLNASMDPAIFYFSSTAIQQTFAKCFSGLGRKFHAVMPWCYQFCGFCCEIEIDHSGVDKSSISNLGELPSERIVRGW